MATPIGPSLDKQSTINENANRELITENHPLGIAGVKTEIFSYLSRDRQDREFAPVASVCKSWHQSSLDPCVAYKQLEATTALTSDEIENWRIIFTKRYKQPLIYDELLRKCPHLETFEYSNEQACDDQVATTVEFLKSYMPPIKTLKFRNCTKLMDPSFKDMQFIQKLEFNQCLLLNAPSLEGMKSLSSLNLNGCGKVTLYRLPDLPSLKTLKLNSCPLTINADFSNLPSLEELDFQGSTFSPGYAFQGVQAIKRISYAYTKNVSIPRIAQFMPHLEELSFEGCKDFKAIQMEAEKMPSLKTLNVSKCPELRTLHLKIPTLKNFYLNDCRNLKEVNVTECAALECLNLNGCTSLIQLEYGQNLQKLFLANCKQLHYLHPNIINLKMLGLRGWEFKSVGFLRKIPSLQRLDLGECKSLKRVDFSGLSGLEKASLHGCTKLTEVRFGHHPKLTHLSLSNCNQIEKINFTGTRSLEMLWLNHCTSLKGIDFINYSKLKKLFINNCPKLKSNAMQHTDKTEIILDS